MQLAERILRELAVSPLLTRQLAARLEANRPGIMAACRCLRVLVERQCPIIIDEAEFTLSSNAAVLEKVRCDGDEGNAGDNLCNYCRALFRANILGRTARTRAYFLRSEANTGPLAPAYNRAEKCVTDRNTGKTYPLEAAHA